MPFFRKNNFSAVRLAASALAALFIVFIGVVVAYGAWSDPAANPPAGNTAAPLTPEKSGQLRAGGLWLNKGGTAQYGLLIGDDPANKKGTGLVGFGTKNPSEKLDVVGDIGITGFIKPDGSAGVKEQALTAISGAKMEWRDKPAWMTLYGNVSKDSICSASPPKPCEAYGYTTSELFCLGKKAGGQDYSFLVRVCKRDFNAL